jgi:hypothetical protein
MKMIVIRFIVTLACAAATSLGCAATPPEVFQDRVKLGSWLAHFHEAPEPDLVPAALLSANKLGMFQGGARSFAYLGFITGVMSKYPGQAAAIARALVSLPADDQPAVIVGVWYSTATGKKQILKSLAELMPVHKDTINYLADNESKPVFTLPMEDGSWVLDVMWGYYMASGDVRAVSRVIDALQLANDPAKNKATAADQAQWSLTVQGKLQPGVLATVRAETTKRDPKTSVLLGQIEKDILQPLPAGK